MAAGMAALAVAWDEREGPAVLATVDTDRRPNAIYVGEIRYRSDGEFVIADNYFDKTRKNIKAGSSGAILFITKDRKAYQAKGTLSYHTEGTVFGAMQVWHEPRHPGVAATVLRVEELYCGAEKLV